MPDIFIIKIEYIVKCQLHTINPNTTILKTNQKDAGATIILFFLLFPILYNINSVFLEIGEFDWNLIWMGGRSR